MWTLLDRLFGRMARSYHRRVFLGAEGVHSDGNLVCYGKIYLFGNPQVSLGRGVRLWPGVSFAGDGCIFVGDNVTIGKDTSIYASRQGGVSVGNDASIAAQCYIVDCNHGTLKGRLIRAQPLEAAAITIGEDVWVAANCSLIKGAKISRGAIIGAGAVVNSEIPEDGIAVGVPARVIRLRV